LATWFISWLKAPPAIWLIYVAAVFHVLCAIILMPVTSHPYDFAVLTSNAQAWLRWGFSPFYNWKFGSDLAAMAFFSQALRTFLAASGVSGTVALHIGWKIILVGADILCAACIYRLGQRFAPPRAVSLALLWLVNPVVLWVSAGHGQVESLALFCMFAALTLALDGKLFSSGVLTGLGTGFEYFPIAVVGAVLVWWRGGYVGGRRMVDFGIGLLSALLVCYLPLLLDATARESLVVGLASSGGLTAGSSESLLSLWAWTGYQLSAVWPIMFGVGGLVCLALSLVFARRGAVVGLVFIPIVLITALLFDANTLPQFAPIAAAALWLLALAVPISTVPLVAVPAAGLATYFLFLDGGASTANAFFYDDWYRTVGVELLPIPISERAAVFLGHIFSFGLVATAIYAAAGRGRLGRPSGAASIILSTALCVLIAGWALQADLWTAAFAKGSTADLPDFNFAAKARAGTLESVGPNVFRVTYPEYLVAAGRRAAVEPSTVLRLSLRDLYDQGNAGTAHPADQWPGSDITIPGWAQVGSSTHAVWVELWLGSSDWSPASQPELSKLHLEAGGTTVSAMDATTVAVERNGIGWALIDFRIPATTIDAAGHLRIVPDLGSLLWRGSSTQPWIRILPASGTVDALIDFTLHNLTYDAAPDGQGYLRGLPDSDAFVIDMSSAPSARIRINSAVLLWPDGPQPWKQNRSLEAAGAGYLLLVVFGTAVSFRRLLRYGPKAPPSHAEA
jgi:hypothetical protein